MLLRANENNEQLERDLEKQDEIINHIKVDIENKDKTEQNKEEIKKLEKDIFNSFDEEKKGLEDLKKKLLDKVDQLKDNIEQMKNLRQTMSRSVSRLEERTKSISDEIQVFF